MSACGGAETSDRAPSYRQGGEFEFVINADGTVQQPVFSTIVSSPSGNPGTIRVATTSAIVGDGLNGCPSGQNCFEVVWENFTSFDLLRAFMGIDSITPGTGRSLVGSDAVPSGVTAPLGGRDFGDIVAGDSSTRSIAITIPNLSSYVVRGRYWFDNGEVSRSYSGPVVQILGTAQWGFNMPGLTFDASDFAPGATVQDVNVSVRFQKTAGTCAVPTANNARHNGTSLRLRGPTGAAVILARSGVNPQWAGAANVGFQDVEYDQAAGGSVTVPAALPVSGTFQPKAGDGTLNTFNGTNPVGSWRIEAGSDAIAPLCIESYTVDIIAF